MPRELNTSTLESYAKEFAGHWLIGHWRGFRDRDQKWMQEEFFKFTFKDEFDHLRGAVQSHLTRQDLSDFNDAIDELERREKRSETLFAELLKTKLAIDTEGRHIPGAIGTSTLGARDMGAVMPVEVELPDSIRRRKRLGLDKSHRETHWKNTKVYWPIYYGEGEERAANSGIADPLPPGTPPLAIGALNARFSNEVTLLGLDALLDGLDEGTLGAVIQGRTGAQPADPDTAVTGTNLFTCTCSATAFGAAVDNTGSGLATANAITDDSSADNTGTLGYCRASSSSVADTPLDDHIDGEAGTSGADWNFNTLSIVSGSTVSITSWTVSQSET